MDEPIYIEGTKFLCYLPDNWPQDKRTKLKTVESPESRIPVLYLVHPDMPPHVFNRDKKKFIPVDPIIERKKDGESKSAS